MLVTAFRSPATAAPFEASIPGSKLPACYFASLTNPFHRPFGLSAPQPETRFASGPGRFHASDPLRLSRSAPPTSSPTSTPLQDFYVLPDQSVQQDSQPAGPPSELARSPFAPRSRLSITRNLGYGSTFQVRYVSGGLLFLKPLGTFLNMLPIEFCVNNFVIRMSDFPQKISHLFLVGYGGRA
jgi:hypothetical protein